MALKTYKPTTPSQRQLVLIDRSPWHEYRPSYLWVMTGKREPEGSLA